MAMLPKVLTIHLQFPQLSFRVAMFYGADRKGRRWNVNCNPFIDWLHDIQVADVIS
jgi:hypothetical protein